MKTLHALLIALSEYPNPQDNLPGCASDFANMKKHLAEFCRKKGMKYNPKELVNKAATRKGIIEGYRHFLQAAPGDTCLVYYTGHGFQVRAASEFWLETDGMHEALYCFDAGKTGRGVMDKELAYLGWKHVEQQGKKLHFVEIFDCCHSGGNTRAAGKGPVARSRPAVRGAAAKLSQYEGIEEYDGYKEFLANPKAPARIQPKLANRIHLSAAKADETAKEDEIEGVRAGFFTHSLCKVLEDTNYTVSYAELMDRAWFKVKELALPSINYMGDQTPLLDAEKVSPHLNFGMGEPGEPFYAVGFDSKRGKWVLRSGATNGIPPGGSTSILIQGKKGVFKLGAVHPDVSELDLPKDFDKKQTYRATIKSMNWDGKQKLAFAPGTSKAEQKTFTDAWKSFFSKKESQFFKWAKKGKEQADFHVAAEAGNFYLTKAGSNVPLFQRQSASNLPQFFSFAESVAKWQLAAELSNPNSKITDRDLEINIETFSYEDNYKTPTKEDWKKPVECRYSFKDNEHHEARLALSVTNRSGRDLWVGMLWLGADFAITHDLIPAGKSNLHPGNTAKLAFENEPKVFVSIPDELRDFGVAEVTEHLKILVSTEELFTENYRQSPLPMDESLKRAISGRPSAHSRESEKAGDAGAPDWNAFTVTMQIVRPNFKNELTESKNVVDIAGCQLSAPAGFTASVEAGTTLTGQRAVGNLPPALHNQAFQDYQFPAKMRATAAPLSTIELRDVKNADLVTNETPLKLALPKPTGNERVVSLGYDAETGLYFPIGFQDKNGVLNIGQLPPPLPDGRRSLGGAVVLFLKKVVMDNLSLGDAKSVYKLRLVTLPEDLATDPVYNGDVSAIKAALDGKKRVLLVLHGIIGDTKEQAKLVKRTALTQPYDVLLAFDFENLKTEIEDIAAELKGKLEKVGLKAGHDKTLHVVAHSMGGLVSRWFIEQLGGDKVVNRLVMVGTPNGGSEWGTAAHFGTIAATFAMNYLTFATPVQLALNFVGKYGNEAFTTLKQMRPGSDFLKKLNASTSSGATQYYIVAGDLLQTQLSDEKRQGFFARLTDRFMKGVGKAVFGSPNDIAVQVKNIKFISFLQEERKMEIACDHLSYFEDEKGLEALEKVLNEA